MLFNSFPFIFLFLPITWLGYFLLKRQNLVTASKTWVLLASLFFYGIWDLHYFPLITLSIGLNYYLAQQSLKEENTHKRPLILTLALLFNLGLLCYFKYANFFMDNLTHLTGWEITIGKVFLPLGLSFYTLQQIAYQVNVHQGIGGKKNFLDYALFVGFFPHIISGPIIYNEETIPQFKPLPLKGLNLNQISLGLLLFSMGLFKKVAIADSLSPWVNEAYKHSETLHFFSAWGASLSYTLQLYFDFSGYTDMAIGLGYLFGVKLPQNFNSPFKCTNINDFWSKWHMTLTIFIRTYIFTPLVKLMPEKTFGFSMLAMFLAMTIAGIWHGAAWTFVIYGMAHGLAIVIFYYWKKSKKLKLPNFLACFITFNFVNLSFVLFRAKTLQMAMNVYESMIGLHGVQIPKMGIKLLNRMNLTMGPHMSNDENLQLALIVVGFSVIYFAKSSKEIEDNFVPTPRWAFFASLMFVISLLGLNRVSEFIYFNF